VAPGVMLAALSFDRRSRLRELFAGEHQMANQGPAAYAGQNTTFGPAPLLESTSGRPCLLFVEHRECRCLNAIRVRYHKIYCECLAVFGDCAANLAYWLASFF